MARHLLPSFFVSVLLHLLLQSFPTANALNVTKVMTFNVLCEVCDIRGFGRWKERLPHIADLLDRHQPDIIGFQEPIDENNVEQLQQMIPHHVPLFFNHSVLPSYPDATIFYDRRLFKVAEWNVYWLSEHPDRPFSMGWVLSLPRVVVWAKMVELASNQVFVFSSTHFDNNGGNKANTVELFLERTKPFIDENLPVIAVGDYNNNLNSEHYIKLTSDPYVVLKNSLEFAPEITLLKNTDLEDGYGCPGDTPKDFPTCVIDHVLLSDTGAAKWQVHKWVVDLYQYGEDEPNFPSDHRAHVVHLSF